MLLSLFNSAAMSKPRLETGLGYGKDTEPSARFPIRVSPVKRKMVKTWLLPTKSLKYAVEAETHETVGM